LSLLVRFMLDILSFFSTLLTSLSSAPPSVTVATGFDTSSHESPVLHTFPASTLVVSYADAGTVYSFKLKLARMFTSILASQILQCNFNEASGRSHEPSFFSKVWVLERLDGFISSEPLI
jgi:hypothetical protein